jgi:hypothetical protein
VGNDGWFALPVSGLFYRERRNPNVSSLRRRGPPTFRLLRVALYFSLLFTGADERHRCQDALCAREAP